MAVMPILCWALIFIIKLSFLFDAAHEVQKFDACKMPCVNDF